MKWIGLTGGLASGKSTVARLLRTKGYPVIDADELAKDVVAKGTPGLTKVIQEFGNELMLPDGSLDRRGLGQKVFGDAAALLRLENIIHPLVQAEVTSRRKAFAAQGFRMAFYDVPLLFEKNLSGFDAVIVVTATDDTRRKRAVARDGLSLEEIEKRIASQIPLSQKETRADHVVRNDGDLIALETAVDQLIDKLKAS